MSIRKSFSRPESGVFGPILNRWTAALATGKKTLLQVTNENRKKFTS